MAKVNEKLPSNLDISIPLHNNRFERNEDATKQGDNSGGHRRDRRL